MLHDFLISNRSELIDRCRAKVLKRRAPRATPAELEHGVPLFLDQLSQMLPGGSDHPGRGVIAPKGVLSPAEAQINASATLHGSELLRHDFTIEQVVHDYGDLCQSITELADEESAPITVHEFGILNIRLDNAIAGAVTEYARQHKSRRSDISLATNERLGTLGYEMRNLLNTAILAISAIKRGSVGFGGATAGALDKSLIGMRALIDRTLAEVRLEEGSTSFNETIEIGPFILDVQVAASLEAAHKSCEMSVGIIQPGIFVEGDRHILAAAVANLLQNAFKFARGDCHVVLRAYAEGGRVLIEVEDDGVGLPAEILAQLDRPSERHNSSQHGLGLGLFISRKAVEAMGGTLSAREISGTGCVFTLSMPQKKFGP